MPQSSWDTKSKIRQATPVIPKGQNGRPRRSTNGRIALLVPHNVTEKNSKPYLRNGKPIHIPYLEVNSDYTIVYTNNNLSRRKILKKTIESHFGMSRVGMI